MNFTAPTARVLAALTLTAACVLPAAAAHAAPARGTENDPAANAARVACHEWSDNQAERSAASKAVSEKSKKRPVYWEDLAPSLRAENAAVRKESSAINGLVNRTAGRPAIAASLRNYKVVLDQYGAARMNDLAAHGYGKNSWPRSTPAGKRLSAAGNAVYDACRPLWA